MSFRDDDVQTQGLLDSVRLAYIVLKDPRRILSAFGLSPASDDVAQLEMAAAERRSTCSTVVSNQERIVALSAGMSWLCTAFSLGGVPITFQTPGAVELQAVYEQWFVAYGVALLALGHEDGTLRAGQAA